MNMRTMGLVHEISDKKLLGKLERVNQLSGLGMNVPGYFLVHDESTLRELKEEIMIKYDRMSLRTYSKTDEFKEFKCPFFPNHPVKSFTPVPGDSEAIVGLIDMLEEFVHKYYIIVSPPINPEKCLYAGNMITPVLGSDVVHTEFITGPGTVRDVETRGIALEIPRKGEIHYEEKRLIELEQVRDLVLRFPEENMILEWSVYSEKIGQENDELVFWEYRPLGMN